MPMIQGTSRWDWRRFFCLPPKRWRPPPQPPAARARTTQDAVRMKQRREEQMRRMSQDQMSLSQPTDSVAADLTDAQIREAVQAVVGDRARSVTSSARFSSSGETTPTTMGNAARRSRRVASPDPPIGSTLAGDPLPALPSKPPPLRPVQRQAPMPTLGEVRSSDERDSGSSRGPASLSDWRATDRASQERRRSRDKQDHQDRRDKLDRASARLASPRNSLENAQREDILSSMASRQSSGEQSASSTGGTRPPPTGPRELKRIQTTKPNAYAVLSENGALRNTIDRLRSQMMDMRRQLEQAQKRTQQAEERANKGKKARHNLMLYNNIVAAIEATPSNQEKMAGFYQLVSIKHTMIDKERGRIQNREVVMPKETGIFDTWPTLSPFGASSVQQPVASPPPRAAEDPGPTTAQPATPPAAKPPATFQAAPPVLPGQPSDQMQRVPPVEYEAPALPDR